MSWDNNDDDKTDEWNSDDDWNDDDSWHQESDDRQSGQSGEDSTTDWGDNDFVEEEPFQEGDSLSIDELLTTGFEQVVSTSGLQLIAVFAVLNVLSGIVVNSMITVFVDILRSEATDPEVIDVFNQFNDQFAALAVDLPLGVLVVLSIVIAIGTEAVRVVATRVFAAGATDGVPSAMARRRIVSATAFTFIGGIILSVAVSIGALLLILPGLFLFVTMVFFRMEVAVADQGIFSAMSRSWSLTDGHRFELFGLVAVIFIIGVIVGVGTGFVSVLIPRSTTIGSLLNQVINGTVNAGMILFSLSAVTAAWTRLDSARPDLDGPQ